MIRSTKTSLSYSANTFITSEKRKPLYNEQNNLSQKLRYSEVPLYIVYIVRGNMNLSSIKSNSWISMFIFIVYVHV